MKNIKPTNQEINNELNSSKKCRIDSNIISKCADNSMLRLDFQECLNTPSTVTNHHQQMNSFSIKTATYKHKQVKSNENGGKINSFIIFFNFLNYIILFFYNNFKGIIAYCIAHWSEGNWNYLILKQNNILEKPSNYKCIVNIKKQKKKSY